MQTLTFSLLLPSFLAMSGPSDDELHHEAEKIFGGPPPKMTPEEGLEKMAARREYLLKEMRDYSEAANRFPDQAKQYTEQIWRIRKELEDTEARIAEYQAQIDGRN